MDASVPFLELCEPGRGGVVWDSDPEAELEESWSKARLLLEAIGSRVGAPTGSR